MGLSGYFKYADDVVQSLTALGRNADPELIKKLSADATSFFSGKNIVTKADVDQWMKKAAENKEFSEFLGTRAIRGRVSEIMNNSLKRQDFIRQFEDRLGKAAGNLSDSQIATIARANGLKEDDALVKLSLEIRDQKKAQAAAGATGNSGRVEPKLGDNLDDGTKNAGRVEPTISSNLDEGAKAGGRVEPTLGDNLDDGAKLGDEGPKLGDEGGDGAKLGDEGGGGGPPNGPLKGDKHGRVDGRVMPINHETWVHRLAAFHPSNLFEKIPFIGKQFSLGNVKLGIPNLFVTSRFIRPAVEHVDDALKQSGIIDDVIKLQGDFKSLTNELARGNIDSVQASAKVRLLFSDFADKAGRDGQIDSALAAIQKLRDELDDGASVLEGKYTGKTGLSDRQTKAMSDWLNDMRDTLTDLKVGDDGRVAAAEKYASVLEDLAKKNPNNRQVVAEAFGFMMNSRLSRVGENVRLRTEGTVVTRTFDEKTGQMVQKTDSAYLQDRAALERQIEGGYYNEFDRAAKTISGKSQNIEMNMFKILNQFKTHAGKQWDVDASDRMLGWMDQFYSSGYEHDVNRIIRVLKAKMGGSALDVASESLTKKINELLDRPGVDAHRKKWYDSVKEALADNKDRNTKHGPREVERKYYSPFAEFSLIATGYPIRKGPSSFFTELSVPTLDTYVRVPITNAAKETWAYLTGGRAIKPAGYKEGDTVIDASHTVKSLKYDWWFRKAPSGEGVAATNTGLFGRGTDRSLFGVLGKDGYLDRMPWYMKMPAKLASGGMLSTESKVGLTLPGKVLVGGLLVTTGIEKGTEWAGWNGFDDKPGLQIPWVDPRDPIHALQKAGIGFQDLMMDSGAGSVASFVTRGKVTNLNILDTPIFGEKISDWVLSWTKTDDTTPPEVREEVRKVSDEMKARAQAIFDEVPTHAQSVMDTYASTEQLMNKLKAEADAAKARGETEKAAKLEQLHQQLGNDQLAVSAYMAGMGPKKAQTQEALEAFRNSKDVLEAEEALLVLEGHRDDMRLMSTQARQTYDGMRTKIGAVPEAAAVLGAVAVPPPPPNYQPDPNAGAGAGAGSGTGTGTGTSGDSPVFIGQETAADTRTGTPEQQLTAVKREAARAAQNAQQSANSANSAVTYMNDTVRQIRELQEYARDNGGNPDGYNASLAEAQRLAQEANIAAQEAQERQRQTAQLLTSVNAATLANLEAARTNMQTMQEQARQGRLAQQRAAQTNTQMRKLLETDTALDDQLSRRRQDERVRSVTGFMDGGGNGLFSNLTKDRGQPGGTSFLGQMFNSASDAMFGIKEWWTRDVARAASRSEGGKMMYQGANVALGGIAALLGVGLWNSTIGKWTGTQINGGVKLLVVGAVLLYMFRGTSETGDRLDKMAGRYRATGDDYNAGTGTNGPSPFRAGTVSVRTEEGGVRDATFSNPNTARTLSHEEDSVFRETMDKVRREANMQGSGSALPSDAGEVYHRAYTVKNSDGKVLGSDVVDFKVGGAQQELAPAQ